MGYKDDLRLELKFARQIKMILGGQFIRQDVVADMKQATDFLIFTIHPIRVGARLRAYKYLSGYGNQFTIRWSRPSGVPTEIHKIREGLVDFLFYGFVNETETNLVRYFIADLHVFASCEPSPLEIKPNRDKSSSLAAYALSQFPDSFIIHKHFPDSSQMRLLA